ncbi:MAG TPA: ATP-binding protein [Pyrinomonadaceae bacterium]|nr:ATP-binding protein [Pyrinomonadaceae bacterium]
MQTVKRNQLVMNKELPGNPWRFESHGKWTRAMLTTAAKQTSINAENSAPDDLLRAIIDACISNVAVLDESGAIIYASKAWGLLEQDNYSLLEEHHPTQSYFGACRRSTDSDSEDESNITLADDLGTILAGDQREFHRPYRFDSPEPQRAFVVHAARLNLAGSGFRVLITREELPFVREDFRDSKERLIDLLGTNILAWEGELEGQRFTYVSEEALKMLGYPIASWYEPDFLASHIHADDLPWVLAAYRKQTRITEHFNLTFRMWTNDGRLVWVQNLISVGAQHEGTTKLHGYIIDVSERKQAEEALKDLGGRLIAAQEDERRRVARELHDDFNQRLAVLSVELEQVKQRIEKPLELRRTIERLQEQAQEIAAEIHRLSYRLHPSKLDHLGLAAAVKSLCAELTESGKLETEFVQTGFPFALDKDITLCVFRIAQEALRNCVKHARADSARVMLTRTRTAVRLVVSDNGCGFNTKTASMEKGLGFISMKERLHLLEGELKVNSRPFRGTRIEVSVPLKLN